MPYVVEKRENSVKTRPKLRDLIFAAIFASLVGPAPDIRAEIEEVIVTARKKTENLQDTSIAIQAIDELALEDLSIDYLTDYIMFLPGVKAGGRGPAQNEIYIRGAAVDAINISVAEAQGSAPNVALYLDEQPVTAGGRNLDVYVADIARVEVLPGPQGTLYGSSSQAGTVRVITNKPAIDEFQLGFDASASWTAEGEMSNSTEAMINWPAIDGTLALRAVLFNDQQGGYIDNVSSTLWPDPSLNPRLPPAEGIEFVPAGGDPTSHEFADGTFAEPGKTYPVQYTPTHNDHIAEDDFNDASYEGFRLGAQWQINLDWDLLLQHHQQTINVEGVFDYDPTIGELQVARFSPDTLEDTFGQTSWTLQGRLERLDMIYTGAFLRRDVSHVYDYTEYINVGGYIPGYICEYNTPGYHGGGGVGYTNDPTLSGDPGIIECKPGDALVDIYNENSRWTHEYRINTTLSPRFGLTAGVFYQDRLPRHAADFDYRGTEGWPRMDVTGISKGTANNLALRSPSTQFTNDITRPETERAIFSELTWSITDAVEAIVGFRSYSLEVGFEGFSAFRYGSRPVPNLAGEPGVNPNPIGVGGRDYQTNLRDFQPLSIEDTITKFSVSWKASDDVLIFATLSEGYRPPGFNRAAAAGLATAAGVAARGNDGPGGFPDYFIPVIYRSDLTQSREIGWKSIALDRRLRFNGSLYRINWDDIQVSHFDSQNISIFTLVDNGGDAVINGLEADLVYVPTAQLYLSAAVSYNNTELVAVNPTFDFVVADAGSELPLTPKLQFALRARHERAMLGGLGFAQIATTFAGESFNSLVDIPIQEPRQVQDSWTNINVSVGLRHDEGWTGELFIENLTDTRAQLHINRQDFRERITTIRPRTMGFRFGFRR